jgi:pyruvate dehydrogenase E2 component (dihydrolipoamide acetyltransferase)
MAEVVFNLPDLGEGLEDAEILQWRVNQGDLVEHNQALVEVNTAKAQVEIPSPHAGLVRRLHAAPGDVVRVGESLVTFVVWEEVGRQPVLVGAGLPPEPARPARRLRPPGALRPPGGPAPASPPVRRLARELGVDLALISGSGSGGRVTRDDVLQAAERGSEAPAAGAPARVTAPAGPEERMPVRGTRRLVAEKMARAWREVPHVTTFLTLDATELTAFRAELAATEPGVRVTVLPIVVRALVEVCREHPALNASFDAASGEIVLRRYYHVGIATDTERGLLVPVVRDVDRKGVLALAGEIGELVIAARAGTATADKLAGSTITISSVGTFGAETGTPILNFPEAALLALGVIEPRALVVEGRVEPRPAATLSLTFDHRVLDGADAGRALLALREFLQDPARLRALPR